MRKYDDTAVKELIKTVQNGSDAESNIAQKEVYEDNIGLIWSVVKRYMNKGTEADDLFQIGSIGLIKAIRNFDLNYDVCFSTYAVPMIIGEIRRYLRDNNPIRVSRSLRDIAYRALQVRDKLMSENSKEPTIEEIAKILDVPKEEVVFAMDAIQEPISLFEPIYHDGGDPIYVMDQISDEKGQDLNWIEEISIREAMEKLGSRERLILNLRFFQGRTQMEVAEEIGISQAQVSRLEKNALSAMRKELSF